MVNIYIKNLLYMYNSVMSTKKLTQTEFINRCKSIHGEKYDYSSSIYKNMGTKVKIKCNICNNFWEVTPGNHLGLKSGCPVCKISNQIKRNTESSLSYKEFVNRSNVAHNNKYDYSKTEYINSNIKVEIICPQHGKFTQWPSDHMRGIGCSLCSGSKVVPDEFIEKMKLKHTKFDFSKFVYTTAKTKSIVICPVHGEFLQNPNTLNNAEPNHGCEKCGTEVMLSTKIRKGDIRSPDQMSEFEAYKRNVWKISNQQYKLYKDIINPEGLPRSLKYHLDHKYSIQQGWQNNVPAEIIGGYKNLQILEGKKNRQKGNRCDITLEEISV